MVSEPWIRIRIEFIRIRIEFIRIRIEFIRIRAGFLNLGHQWNVCHQKYVNKKEGF